ncbi:MAG: hypothetical protein IKB09_07975 [Oscillospiraceae bacterium]|nr:hypothetical protein [Oscillospiraceae bacterium]
MNKQQNIAITMLLTGVVLSRYQGTVMNVIGVASAMLGLLLALLDSRNVSKGLCLLGFLLTAENESGAMYAGLALGLAGVALLAWNGKR